MRHPISGRRVINLDVHPHDLVDLILHIGATVNDVVVRHDGAAYVLVRIADAERLAHPVEAGGDG